MFFGWGRIGVGSGKLGFEGAPGGKVGPKFKTFLTARGCEFPPGELWKRLEAGALGARVGFFLFAEEPGRAFSPR